jgi:cysteine desulfurase
MPAIYLDCNASTPIDPAVGDVMRDWLTNEYGNASSRTHEFGLKAKRAIGLARKQVASVLAADHEQVFFTSGATESNNLSILGLADWCERTGNKHIITSAIEHSAVLEPIAWLRDNAGFSVTELTVSRDGVVASDDLKRSLRPDTALVSIMHVNNETGVIQPLRALATVLAEHPAFFHVDAAQGFGKEFVEIADPRIDLISCTGHKIYGPQGIGALIVRRSALRSVPLKPIMFGGGHERGLRPGTLPTHLIVGFGTAAALALVDGAERTLRNLRFRKKMFDGLAGLPITTYGLDQLVVPHVANLSIDGISSEAAMVALRQHIAISNGSACTSSRYEPSHVLSAMGLTGEQLDGAMRFSWCHLTPDVDWSSVHSILADFL